MGTSNKDSGMGGCHPKGLGGVFQGGSVVGSFIQVRDVVDEPPHGTGPGKLPAQGRQLDNGYASEATVLWKLVVPTAVYSNGGGGFLVDGI